MPALLLVLTTVATREDAQALAHALVEDGLAACAQIGAIQSVYRWEGAVHSEGEYRLLFKTPAERYPEVEAAILARHPYALPAIVAVPVAAAHAAFADWVAANASGPAADASR